MTKEYRRTCTRCATEWFIPKALADERAPNRFELAGARLKRTGSNAAIISFARGRRQAKVADLEARVVRVAENSRCPKCGSTAFTQVRG